MEWMNGDLYIFRWLRLDIDFEPPETLRPLIYISITFLGGNVLELGKKKKAHAPLRRSPQGIYCSAPSPHSVTCKCGPSWGATYCSSAQYYSVLKMEEIRQVLTSRLDRRGERLGTGSRKPKGPKERAA